MTVDRYAQGLKETHMAKANQLTNIFSINWTEVKEDLGFKVDNHDPVVLAIGRFQTAVVGAAKAFQDKRRPNPHVDVPLPKTAEELIADVGDAWVKTIRGAFSDVFKFARFFRGGRFPLFIEGQHESPYTALVEGFARTPKLVGIEQEGFATFQHFGKPFPKREEATG